MTGEVRKFYFIDLFCGAGGTTEGILRAVVNGSNCAEVIACVNHDINAINSHYKNHPEAEHFIEDIRLLDLSNLVLLIRDIKRQDPLAIICLWASLECTNHSRAKGGLSRDGDSRTLAQHLFRYIDELCPDYIWIENVREFMEWGPLMQVDRKGELVMMPDPDKKAIDFKQWVTDVKSRGYEYEHRVLDCANYDCYTHRIRYFAQFAKKGLPIAWPAPVNSKRPTMSTKPLKPVKDVLDLQDTGESIFDRPKPLVEATLERIYKGLVKFVEKKGEPGFISKYYGTGDNNSSFESPCGTLTTKDRMTMISTFIDNQYGNGRPTSVDRPLGTIVVNPKQSIVQATRFIINPQYKNTGHSTEKPCFTLIAQLDKRPPTLIEACPGLATVQIHDTDSHWTRKIKEFMIANSISQVRRRMLRIDELLRIQGFGDGYQLIGTVAEQKKYIGNSVPPPMVEHLICASYKANNGMSTIKNGLLAFA